MLNNYPENQKTLSRLTVIPGKDRYSETVKEKPKPANTLTFTHSIPKNICRYDFNKLIKNRKGKMLNFPSRQLPVYMDIHLEGIQVDTVVIHIGVNDLLSYSNQLRIDSLKNNFLFLAGKWRNYGVTNIFLCGIRLDSLVQVHIMISYF